MWTHDQYRGPVAIGECGTGTLRPSWFPVDAGPSRPWSHLRSAWELTHVVSIRGHPRHPRFACFSPNPQFALVEKNLTNNGSAHSSSRIPRHSTSSSSTTK